MKLIKGGVCSPKGFLAASLSCGIKKSGRNDLALLFSRRPAISAAAFTTNRVQSGSVVLSRGRVKKGLSQAIIVNSGNANCGVGKREYTDASRVTNLVASRLGINKTLVLIASTGIIGRPLPVSKIEKKINELAGLLSSASGSKFSQAITTTDTVPKEVAVELAIDGKLIRIGGAVKGSGMISPNMATMLAFFTTDAVIEKGALKEAFRGSVEDSFNKITVDGDMSTNDSAFILANGMAGNSLIKKGSKDYYKFLNALRFAAEQLAKKIVLDGEGATRFVEILVKGTKDSADAEKIARRIANSPLIKTMIGGGDPNWGRVLAVAGSSGIDIKKDKLDIYFGRIMVMKNGSGADAPKEALMDLFKKEDIQILVDLKSGKASSRIWTCDLTEEYVRINAEYEA